MTSISPAPLGNLVRLTPMLLNELPAHSSIPNTPIKGVANEGSERPRPDLLTFLRAILDEGGRFLSKDTFQSSFKSHSSKSAPPCPTDVQVSQREISASDIERVAWDSPPIPRRKPLAIDAEHWFARRSHHPNISSKEKKGNASWDEFVFGLRDQHSKHECDFTPTLYDAHHILDWNEEVRALEGEGKLGQYNNATMSIYEMCHAIPAPLQPRCFPVLVCTASTSPTSFIAVTVPVDLESLPASFYTNSRNVKEGSDAQGRKKVVLGVYTAIENTYIDEKGEIDWTMATASDAKGNLPMFAQKMGIPGAVVKDVTFFLNWIPTVDSSEIMQQPPSTS